MSISKIEITATTIEQNQTKLSVNGNPSQDFKNEVLIFVNDRPLSALEFKRVCNKQELAFVEGALINFLNAIDDKGD